MRIRRRNRMKYTINNCSAELRRIILHLEQEAEKAKEEQEDDWKDD